MNPLQWIGAVRMRTDKNITIIHSSPSINVLWSKRMCVCNEQIHQGVLTLNHHFWLIHKSITLPPVKKSCCLLSSKIHPTYLFRTVLDWSQLISARFSPDSNRLTFHFNHFLLTDWNRVAYCGGVSFICSHSDGTHSLQWIHWWAT